MRYALLLASLVLALCTTLAAEEPQTYPGIEEIIPRGTQIIQESSATLSLLDREGGAQRFSRRVEEVANDLVLLQRRTEGFGPIETWDVNRLLTVNSSVEHQQQRTRKLLEEISATLRGNEEIRHIWNEYDQFWKGWQKSLSGGGKTPPSSLTEARQRITEVISASANISTPLLNLQRDASAVNTTLIEMKVRIDDTLIRVRQGAFQRNALPLFAPDVYRQLSLDIEALLPRILERVKESDPEFMLRQGWQLALHLFTILALSIGFRLWQRHAEEDTEDWLFLRNHPFAGAFFIASVCWLPWYHNLPPLIDLVLQAIAVTSLATLAVAILPRREEQILMILLALVEFLSRGFKIILLPVSLHRFYLGVVCISGLAYLGLLLFRRRKNPWDDAWFTLRLFGGVLILGTALLAQVIGFATLSDRLIDASVATLFLFFYLVMAIRLGEGGIDFFLTLRPVRRLRFVRSLGAGSVERLQFLYRILFVPAALFSLVTIWGVYNSAGEAWSHLVEARLAVGNFTLSFGMIGMVFFSLYLAYLASWLLQAFLDAQIFPGKRLDRGIRDAVKKLLHYGLMISGFLVAVSMAGIDLQNFAILAGALGVGIGFGMQEIVNNFVSGLIILFERPIKVGDTIVIDGQWGEIAKIGMRSTVVATWDRAEIIVPNAQILSEKVVNWTLSNNVSRISLPVGVKYGTPMEDVLRILIDCATGHEGVIADPAPSAIFTGFGESSLDFELRAWVSSVNDRLRVRSDLGVAIDKAFRQAGIEIPFPQRDLHLRSIDLPAKETR